jgi:hypothetical protein
MYIPVKLGRERLGEDGGFAHLLVSVVEHGVRVRETGGVLRGQIGALLVCVCVCVCVSVSGWVRKKKKRRRKRPQ